MKFRLLASIIICSANLIFAGSYWSSQPAPKVRIASREALEKRIVKTKLSPDFLEKTKFFEIFQDKECSLNDIETGFKAMTNNLWAAMKEENKEQWLLILAMTPVISQEMSSQFSTLKPELYQVLLDDHPGILTQIPEYVTFISMQNNDPETN